MLFVDLYLLIKMDEIEVAAADSDIAAIAVVATKMNAETEEDCDHFKEEFDGDDGTGWWPSEEQLVLATISNQTHPNMVPPLSD